MSSSSARLSEAARICAGGLFALFFACLIQALTLFGVITMNSGHVFMVITFLVGLLLIETEVFHLKSRRYKLIATAVLFAVLLATDLAAVAYVSRQPKIQRFMLTAGGIPTPPGPACTGNPDKQFEVPKGSIAVFFGSSIAITKGDGIVIVSIDRETVLSFRRSTGAMFLYATLRDSIGGEALATIKEDIVSVDARTGWQIQNPDAHNLSILNERGQKMLSIKYLNDSAIVVSGIFYGAKSGPFWVSEGIDMSLPNHFSRGQECFEDYGGPLFRFP